MAEMLPRIGIACLAAEKYLSLFRDQIAGIVGIGSFFNSQHDRFPRDVDLIVVTPNDLVQETMISSGLITYQLHKIIWDLSLKIPVQVGIWPEVVDPLVGWYDPVLGDAVKRGLVLAGKAPQWPTD